MCRYLVSRCVAARRNHYGTSFLTSLSRSWTSSTSGRSRSLLLNLIRLDQVFSFRIFRRVQAALLGAIVATSSILRRLSIVFRRSIFVRKHEVVILSRWIHEVPLIFGFIALATSVVNAARVGTFG